MSNKALYLIYLIYTIFNTKYIGNNYCAISLTSTNLVVGGWGNINLYKNKVVFVVYHLW